MCKYSIVNNYRSQNPLGECSHSSSGYLWDSEPSWAFDIKAVTGIEKLLSDRILDTPPLGWKDLGELGKSVLLGHISPEDALESLEKFSPFEKNPKWKEICLIVKNRLTSTRPSRKKGTLLSCLDLAQQWLDSSDDIYIQALDFNRIFLVKPDPAKPPTYLPSRTAILRSNKTKERCATASPRFHPSPDEFTFGRHDYEGLCEAMWHYTRATEFECWRTGARSPFSEGKTPTAPSRQAEPVI